MIPALAVVLGAGDFEAIIHIDRDGNACSGVRAGNVRANCGLFAYSQGVAGARVFAEVTPESTLWYENSHSMVEIAANRTNAAPTLGLHVGDRVS